MQIQNYIKERSIFFDQYLYSIINERFKDKTPIVCEAMEYSLTAGGKRLRPILSFLGCELFEGDIDEVLPFAAAIEMIHTYSLIHDDLPAMDNDDYRRGKLSNHKVYGEGFSILAGDGLLNYSIELLLEVISKNSHKKYINAASILYNSTGINGMIGGQAIDLFYEGKVIDINTLELMHKKKTGALIEASISIGAILADASEIDIDNIKRFGALIGKAFQITDDILDVIGESNEIGKPIGSDMKNNKATYTSIYGVSKSKDICRQLIDEAINIIDKYENRASNLKELAHFIINRQN